MANDHIIERYTTGLAVRLVRMAERKAAPDVSFEESKFAAAQRILALTPEFYRRARAMYDDEPILQAIDPTRDSDE